MPPKPSRSTVNRTARPTTRSKTKTTSADELATTLATKLTISDTKGKAKASPLPDEDRRTSAMREVNSASKSLSAAIESGWKQSQQTRTSRPSPSALAKIASDASKSLRILRSIRLGDVDVERAASSLAGKLITLELYTSALETLSDMQGPLISLYLDDFQLLRTYDHAQLLALPLPRSDLSDVIATLISSYMLHTVICVCRLYTDTSALLSALHDAPCIVRWTPFFRCLTSKQHQAVFTRIYSTLTSYSSMPHVLPPDSYRLRSYGLLCLARTRPTVIAPTTFWDQAVKFAAAYVTTANSDGDRVEVTRKIMRGFEELVKCAEIREDKADFMNGPGFIRFCEYWTGCARQVGDVETFDRINELLHSIRPSDTASGPEDRQRTIALSEGASIYAFLAQGVASIERGTEAPNDTITRLQDVISAIRKCPAYFRADNDDKRTAEKIRRAFERLRRSAVKLLDSAASSSSPAVPRDLTNAVKLVLEEVCRVLEYSVDDGSALDTDLLTSLIDTLITLSRNTLILNNPDTYSPAYELLQRASSTVSTAKFSQTNDDTVTISYANYTRCVSSAFHNLAWTLYQGQRYSHAIRFLNEGCALSSRAMEIYRMASPNVNEHMPDAWVQLEQHLYRRWEILGVCQLKTDDRKMAYEALLESVKTFPFFQDATLRAIRTSAISSAFQSCQLLKQIAVTIDRVTYMGVCELFRSPSEVSAKSWFSTPTRSHIPDNDEAWKCIVGAILEKQADGLVNSRWKPQARAATYTLLNDALEVYTSDKRPIRRARVLLRLLELKYFDALDEKPCATDVGQEVQTLLAVEDLKIDSELVLFRAQFLASAHLWLALHAHRRADALQNTQIVQHVQDACSVLRSILSTFPRSSTLNAQPPNDAATIRKRVASKAAPSNVRAGNARTRTTKISKPSRAVMPATPKARKALDDPSLKVQITTPPRPRALLPHSSPLMFEDFPKFATLLHITAQLLGLLGHVLIKVQFLMLTRRLCERLLGSVSPDYITASVHLAHEYVKLGSTKKANNIFHQVSSSVSDSDMLPGHRLIYLLRYAESLGATGNILTSSSMYCEALALSKVVSSDNKHSSTAEKIQLRAVELQRAAIAASTFSVVQHSKDDPTEALGGLLQSLRLWNRAMDTLARLRPSKPSIPVDSNPFDTFDAVDTQPQQEGSLPSQNRLVNSSISKLQPFSDGLEWHIAEGLLDTLFSLTRLYLARGSVREAEYFSLQARDLAQSLNAPAMVCRALARNGEILLRLGHLDEGYKSLTEASHLVAEIAGPDAADVQRLHGQYNQMSSNSSDARELYEEAMSMLDDLAQTFTTLDGTRKSLGLSPKSSQGAAHYDHISPTLLAAILRQQIWLLHNAGEEYKALLARFSALPTSTDTKTEQSALMAKLTLDDVYSRFRADMFLSSLAESAITIPMGMIGQKSISLSPSTQEILGTLAAAEKLFWSDLAFIAKRGNASHVRDTALSLALIRALQTSLGTGHEDAPILAARLLDASSAITLRREMMEIVHQRLRAAGDDLQWPLMTPNGSPLHRQVTHHNRRSVSSDIFDDSASEEDEGSHVTFDQYWEHILKRYQTQILDASELSSGQSNILPSNWTVVNISITEDRNTMFISRQRSDRTPLIFCLPLKGRRDNQDDEHLTYSDAVNELQEIIALSDEGTRGASMVDKDSKAARAAWWSQRSALDRRLQALLENIEFCWLGAFKTVLGQPVRIPSEDLAALRRRLEMIFKRGVASRDRKRSTRVKLDDALLECFAALSADCRDEELEDLIFFVLDLYQFHGVPVALAEVDIDQVVVELRMALEDHRASSKSRIVVEEDSHLFLVLDKNVQAIPWESIPMLRGKSVSRIPSMDFLIDRMQLANCQQTRSPIASADDKTVGPNRIVVDPKKTYYLLNPSGDLKGTEGRFANWLRSMRFVGWDGIVGRVPSEQQFADALARNDLVIYFGHGGAEQYIRSHKIRHLPRCAATMLWGCSSGALKDMGEFDRLGTPYHYMLAGCPSLVANLWDVTDRDIDKFSQSVFDQLHLTPGEVKQWPLDDSRPKRSVVTAVAQARETCKLKYLTGAAPVVYGIPFYL